MPEYLAPGVYIEETSYRSKSIEGVSTTTTGFIGPARYGPVKLEPQLITSLGEFERIYGDGQQLVFDSTPQHNYLWHAVRAFFTEGGKRLYVSRVFNPISEPDNEDPSGSQDLHALEREASLFVNDAYSDGQARGWLSSRNSEPPNESPPVDWGDQLLMRARFAGSAGNARVRFEFQVGNNILGGSDDNPTLGSLTEHDLVWIGDVASPIDSPLTGGNLYLAERQTNDQGEEDWVFTNSDASIGNLSRSQLSLDQGAEVRLITLTVTIQSQNGESQVWSELALDPNHERNGIKDSLTATFAENPRNQLLANSLPISILAGESLRDGLSIVNAIFSGPIDPNSDEPIVVTVALGGGNDGQQLEAGGYEGEDNHNENFKTGLKQFEDLEDISIVAAPGATFNYGDNQATADTIVNLLIAHCQKMKYRIAVLDSGNNQPISGVRAMRARLDSTYAALYYPWVRVLDPITNEEIVLPPSGFVAGIYARNDTERAVYKAPANEVVRLAIGFEQLLNKSQQDVLNPEGINCFRFFEGRGFRLWGARTISSDPEWKYVNLRRYFAYLERSIDKSTQWVVFEPNGEKLWANVRRTIEDFLFNEWQSGALLGEKPEKAFFVRCDRSTMTQNDLDNGRLVCQIGVAALRPAEFVIFRIGQWTADHKA